MKGILVIIDGLGDLPCRQLAGKTPLEAADKPNLDYLASRSKIGKLYPINDNFVPGTSEAIVSFFRQKWQDYPRGWLEALGAGIDLKKGDLALRANFATIDNMKDRNILDRRAGRNLTTKEAEILSELINKTIRVPAKFLFKSTSQHRAVLVFRGGFSDNISPTDPEHRIKDRNNKFRFSVAEDEDNISQYSANVLNNFTEQAYNLLDKHIVNEKRRKKGFFPANIILTRGGGIDIKKITKFNRWACTTSVPVMKGICKVLGINLFEYKSYDLKGDDVYKVLKQNLLLEIKKSIKLIKKKSKEFDYFLVYLKETDAAGHDNKPEEKKNMIEMIDKKFFSFLRNLEKKKTKIIVASDHSTPCRLKGHSADPAPILLCDWVKGKNTSFSEEEAEKGELGKVYGRDVLNLFS